MSFCYVLYVLYKTDRTGRTLELPALFTESGVVISHLRYLSFYHDRSQSWITKSIYALKLLIEYIQANTHSFDSVVELLKSFISALSAGTIEWTKLDDTSGLYWKPRQPVDVNNILRQITQYTGWLETQKGYKKNRANPFREATDYEQRLAWCAYYQKKSSIFLGHLMDRSTAMEAIAKARFITAPRAPLIRNEKLFRFPEEKMPELLSNGLIKAHTHSQMPEYKRLDYKNIAITMLLHYGGLRISEVMHLYLGDITLDPSNYGALVRVYHPAYGQSPDPDFANRKAYLNARYGMKPRNEYRFSERLFAGWKIPVLTDKRNFFEVFFTPDEMREQFLDTWVNYLKYQRIDPPSDNPHPFAFTNQLGAPETIKNFRRLHEKAISVIGLNRGRYNGTTEHCHRHAYGYRLAEMGLDQIAIQKAMHHRNPNSCLTYIQHTSEDIRNKIRSTSISTGKPHETIL